jgi:hypothetical protein
MFGGLQTCTANKPGGLKSYKVSEFNGLKVIRQPGGVVANSYTFKPLNF